jgi:AraC-like DNA-binding protein/mannose-6-phosphate isomerase-like protein (cupin superfamily)
VDKAFQGTIPAAADARWTNGRAWGSLDGVYKREGFAGQRMRVVPASVVQQAVANPVTSWLTVTDCGYFPTAASHRRRRKQGATQTIIIVSTGGHGWCELPIGRFTVDPGQVLTIPAGTPHEYGADDETPWTIWWAHVTGKGVPGLLAAAELSAERPVAEVRNLLRITALIDEALTALEHDDSPPALTLAGGALAHALALIAADRRRVGTHREDPIAAAIEHLRSHVGTRISVAELAGIVGLSGSHLASLFRKATGMGVLEYQTRQRMATARELLDNTDLPVQAICNEVGYSDAFYFSRHFRRLHGMSPSEYRAHDKG